MPDGVGERLLRDAEHGELDVRRRAGLRRSARASPARRRAAPRARPATRAPRPRRGRRGSAAAGRRPPSAASSPPRALPPRHRPGPTSSRVRTSIVSCCSASSWRSAARRARSVSAAATARSRWSCVRLAKPISGLSVNWRQTTMAISQMPEQNPVRRRHQDRGRRPRASARLPASRDATRSPAVPFGPVANADRDGGDQGNDGDEWDRHLHELEAQGRDERHDDHRRHEEPRPPCRVRVARRQHVRDGQSGQRRRHVLICLV